MTLTSQKLFFCSLKLISRKKGYKLYKNYLHSVRLTLTRFNL
jgi:hypothetical protein